MVDLRDILLQLKLSDDLDRKGMYEKDIAILMWQTTIEEEIRVKPEMPVHCRNDYIEGMLTFLVEAQFLVSLPYLKLNAFMYFCGYCGPIMFTMLYNQKSQLIILAAFTTYFWFLP